MIMDKKNKSSIRRIHSNSLVANQQWRIEKETDIYFTLSKSKDTVEIHLIIAVLIGWWLLFIPNLIYHFIMKERIKLKKMESEK
jgi:hypothetical protein